MAAMSNSFSSVFNAFSELSESTERKLMVADTGSTNGTFVSGQRIPYGKAVLINSGEKLMFGTVEVVIEHFENTDGGETFVEKPKAANNLSEEKLSVSEN